MDVEFLIANFSVNQLISIGTFFVMHRVVLVVSWLEYCARAHSTQVRISVEVTHAVYNTRFYLSTYVR